MHDTLYSTIAAAIWFSLAISFYKNLIINWKVASNFTSTIHASTVILFYVVNIDPRILYCSSFGYYIYDSVLNIVYYAKTRNSGYLFMIAHHLATVLTLGYLFNPVATNMIFKNFFLLELSNFPLYIVYHLKSVNYQNKIVLCFFVFLEALGSLICRVILGTGDLYKIFITVDFPWLPRLMGCALYIISVMWLKAMIKQLWQMLLSIQTENKNK